MPPPPLSTPAHVRQDASAAVADALPMLRDDVDVPVAVRLFGTEYDCCGGQVASMVSSLACVAVAPAAAYAASQRRLMALWTKTATLFRPSLSQNNAAPLVARCARRPAPRGATSTTRPHD